MVSNCLGLHVCKNNLKNQGPTSQTENYGFSLEGKSIRKKKGENFIIVRRLLFIFPWGLGPSWATKKRKQKLPPIGGNSIITQNFVAQVFWDPRCPAVR